MQMQKQDSGVSPVIGIILMVAVTVGLVALASTIVFDLGNNVQEPADVSANLNYDNGSTEVVGEVIRNENADRVFLRFTDGDFSESPPVEVAGSAGETGTEVLSVSGSVSGTVELVAEVDGNEQIIDTVQYDNT